MRYKEYKKAINFRIILYENWKFKTLSFKKCYFSIRIRTRIFEN